MLERISPGVKWGAIGLFVGCVMLVPTMVVSEQSTGSALWFVGLLVLMTSALALTAVVFSSLNLTDPGEAFGLPSGSVRTLLAVGVMVLFAVFGLRYLGDAAKQDEQPRLSDKPIEQAKVPADRLKDEVARYEQNKLLAVFVTSPGRAASANGKDDPGANAEISIYKLEQRRSPDAIDIQKQLLTALITLLTTVIGFYFGSKSSGDGLRRVAPPLPTDPSGLGPQRDALKAESDALEVAVTAQRQSLDDLRKSPTPGATDSPDIAAAMAKALAIDSRLDALRQALVAALADVQDKTAAVATAAEGSERSTRLAAALAALVQARSAFDALKQASQQLSEPLAALQKLTAEG